MSKKEYLYSPDNGEEIFWIALSFFAEDYKVQSKIIKLFLLDVRYSNFKGEPDSIILKTLACFLDNRYWPQSLDQATWQSSLELHVLFRLMLNYAILEEMVGHSSSQLWNLHSLKENNIWALVRKMAKSTLKLWSMDSFPFEHSIDINDIGPEFTEL